MAMESSQSTSFQPYGLLVVDASVSGARKTNAVQTTHAQLLKRKVPESVAREGVPLKRAKAAAVVSESNSKLPPNSNFAPSHPSAGHGSRARPRIPRRLSGADSHTPPTEPSPTNKRPASPERPAASAANRVEPATSEPPPNIGALLSHVEEQGQARGNHEATSSVGALAKSIPKVSAPRTLAGSPMPSSVLPASSNLSASTKLSTVQPSNVTPSCITKNSSSASASNSVANQSQITARSRLIIPKRGASSSSASLSSPPNEPGPRVIFAHPTARPRPAPSHAPTSTAPTAATHSHQPISSSSSSISVPHVHLRPPPVSSTPPARTRPVASASPSSTASAAASVLVPAAWPIATASSAAPPLTSAASNHRGRDGDRKPNPPAAPFRRPIPKRHSTAALASLPSPSPSPSLSPPPLSAAAMHPTAGAPTKPSSSSGSTSCSQKKAVHSSSSSSHPVSSASTANRAPVHTTSPNAAAAQSTHKLPTGSSVLVSATERKCRAKPPHAASALPKSTSQLPTSQLVTAARTGSSSQLTRNGPPPSLPPPHAASVDSDATWIVSRRAYLRGFAQPSARASDVPAPPPYPAAVAARVRAPQPTTAIFSRAAPAVSANIRTVSAASQPKAKAVSASLPANSRPQPPAAASKPSHAVAASRLTPTGAALPSVTRPSTHGVSVRFDRSELEKEDAEMFADNGDLIVGSRAPGAKRTKTAKELGTEALEEMARKRGVSTSVPVLSTLTAAKKSTEEAETAETNGEPLPQVCEICERDDVAVTLLLCDGCDKSFHMLCLTPPLTEVPRGQWFCGRCVSKNASVNDSKIYFPGVERCGVEPPTSAMDSVSSVVSSLVFSVLASDELAELVTHYTGDVFPVKLIRTIRMRRHWFLTMLSNTRFVSTSGTYGCTIEVRDITRLGEDQIVRYMEGHTNRVTRAVVMAEAGALITVADGECPKIWDLNSKRRVRPASERHGDHISALCVLPNRKFITASVDGEIRVWDASGSRCERAFVIKVPAPPSDEEDEEYELKIQALPNGNLLAFAPVTSKKVRYWLLDALAGAELSQATVALSEPCKWPKIAALNDEHVAVAANKSVHLLDIAHKRITKTVKVHNDTIRSLAVIPPVSARTPSSGFLITGCADGSIKVWDGVLGRCLQTLEQAHPESVEVLALSPTNETLLSVSADNTLRMWRSRFWQRACDGEFPEPLADGGEVEQAQGERADLG